jgi:hypothetical protein
MHRTIFSLLVASVVALAACGKDPVPSAATGGGAAAPAGAVSRFALGKDPGEAQSVDQALKSAPKDAVVVVGRVRDLTPGFAAFTLVDAGLDFCGHGADTMENCPTPWDYCCIPAEDVAARTIPVAVKEKGDVAAVPKLPELRRLDLVVVTGRLVKDEHGSVALEATGWHRRERPDIPSSVVFPE